MNSVDITRFRAGLRALPLVAILRGITPPEAPAIGRALVEAGFRLIEVPLNSPRPLESIAALVEHCPEALVGAGTVLTPAQVQDVHAAGGRWAVSPHFDAAVVRETLALDMVSVPGIATPSEAFAGLAAGAHALKLFPAEMLSPAVHKALRAVLPAEVPLLPVGGITPEGMAAWRAAGAAGFGIGSALYAPGATADAVADRARAFAAAWASIAA